MRTFILPNTSPIMHSKELIDNQYYRKLCRGSLLLREILGVWLPDKLLWNRCKLGRILKVRCVFIIKEEDGFNSMMHVEKMRKQRTPA